MSKIKGNNIEIENALSINGIPINLLGGGGSGEAQSYITTGRSAESVGDLSAWTIYSNTPGVNPVNGFGGSPNITLTRNTTNPLSGLGDFRITKDAVNRQGQGISIPFTVDNRHLARVLQISFDYETISGILGQDNVRVSIIGDPNGTPFLIEPVNTSIEFPTIGNRSKHIATFQTNFSVKEYRLCIHISSTTTEAFVISFNNFRVWEQDQNYGAIITDWVSYTPIFNNSLNATNVAFYFRRVGSNLEIKGKFTTPSNTSSNTGDADISLPTGLTISTNVPSGVNLFGHIATSYTLYNDFAVSGITGSNWLKLRMFNTSGANPLNSSGTWSAVFQNSIDISLQASVPITGWGSNIALSSDAGDGRVVACQIFGDQIDSVTANTTNIRFATILGIRDTHGAWDNTNGWYTVPVTGFYRATMVSDSNQTSVGQAIKCYINDIASDVTPYFQPTIVGFYFTAYGWATGSNILFLNAGQRLSFRPTASWTVGTNGSICIERISSGSQIIAPVEDTNCLIRTNSNTFSSSSAILSGSWVATEYDTHNMFDRTNSRFNPPSSGKYSFTFRTDTAVASLTYIRFDLYDVASTTILKIGFIQGNTSNNVLGSVNLTQRLLAGQLIDVRISGNVGGTLGSGTATTGLEIRRIGNY